MAIYKGAIIWRGDSGSVGGNETISKVQEFELWASWATYVGWLKAHSLCNAATRIRYRVDAGTPGAPGTGADVGVTAQIFYRDPTNLEVLNYSYPAPIAAEIEDIGYGVRVKKSAVTAIVAELSIIADATYEPLYGTVRTRI